MRFVSNSGNTLAVLDDIPQSVFDDIARGTARQKAWDDFTPPSGFTKNTDNTITAPDGTVYSPNFAENGFEVSDNGLPQFTDIDGQVIEIPNNYNGIPSPSYQLPDGYTELPDGSVVNDITNDVYIRTGRYTSDGVPIFETQSAGTTVHTTLTNSAGNDVAIFMDDLAAITARQQAWDDFTPPSGFTKNADNTITTSDGTVYTPNFSDEGFELSTDGYTQFTSVDGNTIKIYTENPAGRGADFDWLKDHNITPADTYTKDRGISGGHNQNSFNEAIEKFGGKIESSNTNPDMPGVTTYTYRLPKQDGSGELSARTHTKTVYDPAILSDERVAILSAQAAKKAVFKEGKEQTSVQVGRYNFKVYRDEITGQITNAHLRTP